MPYPTIRPSTRQYSPGNWPVRTYNAQNGAEVRLLYGSVRTNLKLQLAYSNLPDAEAAKFLDHFDETKGTYKTLNRQLMPVLQCLQDGRIVPEH